jgi:hypothetical protein
LIFLRVTGNGNGARMQTHIRGARAYPRMRKGDFLSRIHLFFTVTIVT